MDLKNLENIIKQLELNQAILKSKIDTLKINELRTLNDAEINAILEEVLNENTSIERLLELKGSIDLKCNELLNKASQYEEGLKALVNSY